MQASRVDAPLPTPPLPHGTPLPRPTHRHSLPPHVHCLSQLAVVTLNDSQPDKSLFKRPHCGLKGTEQAIMLNKFIYLLIQKS